MPFWIEWYERRAMLHPKGDDIDLDQQEDRQANISEDSIDSALHWSTFHGKGNYSNSKLTYES